MRGQIKYAERRETGSAKKWKTSMHCIPGFITQGQKIKKGAGEGLPKDDCLLQKQ